MSVEPEVHPQMNFSDVPRGRGMFLKKLSRQNQPVK